MYVVYFVSGACKSYGSRGTYASRTAVCAACYNALHDVGAADMVQLLLYLLV